MRRYAAGIVAVLAVSLCVGGCSNTRSDQSITTAIEAKLFSDPQVKNANLTVSTKDGVVTLAGNVPGDAARYEAFKVASETNGVKKVNDEMTVSSAQTQPAPGPETAPAATPQPERAQRHESAPAKRRVAENRRRAYPASKPDPEPSRQKTAENASAGRADVSAQADSAPVQSPAEPTTDSAPTNPAGNSPQLPPEPAVQSVEIPAGTSIRIQMIDTVDSAVNHVGDTFHASLAAPIVVNNQVVVPAGTDIYVRLASVTSAGHLTGRSEVGLELDRLEYQGQVYPLASNEYRDFGASRGKNTAEKVGGGAAIGALLGAIIGHGKGAAIGAAIGAGAGTADQEATHAKQVRIPSETKLDFSLEQPVTVSYSPGQDSPRQ